MRPTTVRRLRGPVQSLLIGALAVGLALVPAPGRARAQSQALDTRSVTLASPAVSFVRTDLRVCVRVQLSNLGGCYEQAYSGSAFAINPNGSLVTASHVVVPDGEDRKALRNYAANRLFNIPLRADQDPNQRYELPGQPERNFALQACYARDICDFNLKTTVRVYPAVQVAGVSVPKPLSATVVRSSDFEQADVAVLQVDATNMPTVQLEASTNDLVPGDTVVALGYPGSAKDLPTGMTEPTKTFGRVSNIRTGAVGSSKQIEVDLALKRGTSGGPVVNANGKVVGLTSYSLLGDGGTSEQGYIRTVEDIRAALKAAGVEAARGDGDTVFAQAMQHFWNRHYSASLPLFQKVLNLYDGHPVAKEYLAKAQAKANGPEDLPLSTEGLVAKRRDFVRAGLAVAGVLLVLVALLVVLRRRRRPARPVAPPEQPTSPGGGSAEYGWAVDDEVAPATAYAPPTPAAGTDPVSGVEQPAGVATAIDAAELDRFERVTAPSHRFCSQCGNELNPGARFCSVCGQPVR